MKKTYKINKTGLVLLCSLIGLSFWVCSKNSPLDPGVQNPGGQVKILVGLQSNPGIIAPGGSSIVRALVLDQVNQPVVGEDVLFSTNTGTLNPTTATTNDSGFATTIFTATQPAGSARISGLYDGTQTETVTIEINDTTPQSVTLTPDAFSFLPVSERSFRPRPPLAIPESRLVFLPHRSCRLEPRQLPGFIIPAKLRALTSKLETRPRSR